VLHPGVTLVHAVHGVAVAAVFTIAAGAAEKTDADPLANGPALDAFSNNVDLPDRFVPGDPRPLDRQDAFDRGRVRVTNAAGLDPDPDMASRRLNNRQGGELQLARAHCLHRAIGGLGLGHGRLLSFSVAFKLARGNLGP